MTPAQQVSWVRDVPASCVCEQVWRDGRWVRSVPHPSCPWHVSSNEPEAARVLGKLSGARA